MNPQASTPTDPPEDGSLTSNQTAEYQPPNSLQQTSSMSPQPTVAVVSNEMVAPKKSKKVVIIGISVALVAVTCSIVGYLLLFSGPSKADYERTSDDLVKLQEAFSQANIAVLDSAAMTSSANKQFAVESVISYSKKFDELKTSKALFDRDVKTKYDELARKSDVYVKLAADFANNTDTLKDVKTACVVSTETFDGTKRDEFTVRFDAVAEKCKKALTTLESSKNSVVSTFAKKATKSLTDMRVLLVAMISEAKNGSQQATTARMSFVRAMLEHAESIKNFSNTTSKQLSDASISKELTTLKDTVQEKVNKQ